MQIYLSRHIFSRSCVKKPSIVEIKKVQVIIPFCIFAKFSPKVQIEALTRHHFYNAGTEFDDCELN